MKARTAGSFQLTDSLSELYGYIYCMLVSSAVVGMPLFGGALYLCGHAANVLFRVYGPKNRRFLPAHARFWGIILAVVLLVTAVALMGIYPAGFQSPKVWLVFATVALCLCADGMVSRIRRLRGVPEKGSTRAWAVTLLLQVLIIAAEAVILWNNTDHSTALALTGGFALLVVIRAVSAYRLYSGYDTEIPIPESAGAEIPRLPAFRSFGVISFLIVAALELTVSAIYALLVTGTEPIPAALGIGIGCTLLAACTSILFLRRSRKPNRKDPTWLLCVGLLLCLGGVWVCGWMISDGVFNAPWMYVSLALCSFGSTLCFAGLGEIDSLVPQVAELGGDFSQAVFLRVRECNWDLARLLGDVLCLILLTVLCFVNGTQLPQDFKQFADRFQPLMIVPLALVMIAALIGAFCFPLNPRYIRKLRMFMRLKQAGEPMPALRRQLENVVANPSRQKWMTRFLMACLRPFYRHKLVNADHIRQDSKNPIVFLSNHGEIYGPIVCSLFFPVPIRFWTISSMMSSSREVRDYMYENTFSKKTFLPVFVRKGLAALLGWMSVNVMSQLESIAVYRDSPMKLRETVRQSIEAMESGDNLLIFPESPDGKYQKGGIGEISPGFVMLAEAYWKKTGKRLRMMPVYADRKNRTITFGEEIRYIPENGYSAEQDRIVRETREQILRMSGYKEEETENGDPGKAGGENPPVPETPAEAVQEG